MTAELAVVLGAGPVGLALTERLVADEQPVRVVTRSGDLAPQTGVEVVAADIRDPEAAARACAGAGVVYGCVGLDYTGWPERWPPMMQGMLAGSEAAGARFVFMDNCYMYGPVDEPMHEGLPLTDYGRKPAARSRITRMWQEAHRGGRVEAAAVRASDFYGPGVMQAAIGERSVGRIAKGKPAQMVGDRDQLHSFTYVPDIARALVTVGRSEDAMGQAWHVPNAPDLTPRELLELFARELGRELRIQSASKLVLTMLGLVDANARELKEMLYQWERPFRVDSSKFAQRFWSDATPFAEGVAASAPSYAVAR
jgi:nucleoside-diphosphate-sugar epimerase